MFIEYMLRVGIRPHRDRIISFRDVSRKIKSLRDYDVFSERNPRTTFIQKKYSQCKFNFQRKIRRISIFIEHLPRVRIRPHRDRIISFSNISIKIKSLRDYDVFSGRNPRTTFIQKKYS